MSHLSHKNIFNVFEPDLESKYEHANLTDATSHIASETPKYVYVR